MCVQSTTKNRKNLLTKKVFFIFDSFNKIIRFDSIFNYDRNNYLVYFVFFFFFFFFELLFYKKKKKKNVF